jgi:ABC-2 type transport system permease protein
VRSDVQAFQMIMNFLAMPMFFLSGALFLLRGLPKALDFIARIDPLSYGVDGLRSSMTSIAHFGLTADFSVLSVLSVVLLVVGSQLFSKIQV